MELDTKDHSAIRCERIIYWIMTEKITDDRTYRKGVERKIMKMKKHSILSVLSLGLSLCIGLSGVLCVMPVCAQEQEPPAVEATEGPTVYETDGEPLQVVDDSQKETETAESSVSESESTPTSSIYSTDSLATVVTREQTQTLSSDESNAGVVVTKEDQAVISTEDAIPGTGSSSVNNIPEKENAGELPCETANAQIPDNTLSTSDDSAAAAEAAPSLNNLVLEDKNIADTIPVSPDHENTAPVKKLHAEGTFRNADSVTSVSYVSEGDAYFSKLFTRTTVNTVAPTYYLGIETRSKVPGSLVTDYNGSWSLTDVADDSTYVKIYSIVSTATTLENYIETVTSDDLYETTSTTIYREPSEPRPDTLVSLQETTYTTINGKVYSGKIYKRWTTSYTLDTSLSSTETIVYGWSTEYTLPVYTNTNVSQVYQGTSTSVILPAGYTVPIEIKTKTEVITLGTFTTTNFSAFWSNKGLEKFREDPRQFIYTTVTTAPRYYATPVEITTVVPQNAALTLGPTTCYIITASVEYGTYETWITQTLTASNTNTLIWSCDQNPDNGEKTVVTTTVYNTILSEYWTWSDLNYDNPTYGNHPTGVTKINDYSWTVNDPTLTVYVQNFTTMTTDIYTVSYSVLAESTQTIVYNYISTDLTVTDYDYTYLQNWSEYSYVYIGLSPHYTYRNKEITLSASNAKILTETRTLLEHAGDASIYMLTYTGDNNEPVVIDEPAFTYELEVETEGYRYPILSSTTSTALFASLIRCYRTFYYSPVYEAYTSISWELISSMDTTTAVAPSSQEDTGDSTRISSVAESRETSDTTKTSQLLPVSAVPGTMTSARTESGEVLGAMHTISAAPPKVSEMITDGPSRDAKTGDSPLLFWYLVGILSGAGVLSAWFLHEKRHS